MPTTMALPPSRHHLHCRHPRNHPPPACRASTPLQHHAWTMWLTAATVACVWTQASRWGCSMAATSACDEAWERPPAMRRCFCSPSAARIRQGQTLRCRCCPRQGGEQLCPVKGACPTVTATVTAGRLEYVPQPEVSQSRRGIGSTVGVVQLHCAGDWCSGAPQPRGDAPTLRWPAWREQQP